MATTRSFRMPLEEKDRKRLADLLEQVPTETVVRYVWSSDAGRAFIKELRRLQVSGVPANWMAEALNVSVSAINGALGYWVRSNSRNPRSVGTRRQRRPLRSSEEAAE